MSQAGPPAGNQDNENDQPVEEPNTKINALAFRGEKYMAVLKFDSNMLLPDLSTPEMKHVSVEEIVPAREIPDGSYIIGCLIRVVHGKRDAPVQLSSSYQNRQRAPQRRIVEKNYSRMLFFSDPSSPRKCFVLFESSDYSEKDLWGNLFLNRGELGIGDFFLIMEPETNYTTNAGMMVVSTKWSIIPLCSPYLTTSYALPAEAGKIESFFINPARVSFSKITVTNSKCGGTFCDRQDPTVEKCACYASGKASKNFVFSFRIEAVSQTNNFTVKGEMTSWKLSQLVFKNGEAGLESQSPDFLKSNIFRIRKAFNDLADAINNTPQKWTIVGWQKLGEVGEDHNVSETATVHMVTIVPNNTYIHNQFLTSNNAIENNLN